MTIDITIGKLKKLSFEEGLKEQLDNEYIYTYKSTFCVTDFLDIEQCPPEDDDCTEEDTMYPGEAYRSGSISGMTEFFEIVLPDLINDIRANRNNDRQYTLIEPFIEKINLLIYEGDVKQHNKRLHWLKFWCNRAVELYGEEAVILFS